MSIVFRWFAPFVLGFSLLLGQTGTDAHEALVNKAVLGKISSKSLSLRLEVDPVTLLYKAQVKGASVSFEVFLTRYAAMPVKKFAQELMKIQALIAKDLSIVGADGLPLAVVGWEWPDTDQWQGALRTHLTPYQANPNDLGHMPPITVGIRATGLRDLSHVHLSLPRAMQPILVQASPTDLFWLSEKIPVAVVSFDP